MTLTEDTCSFLTANGFVVTQIDSVLVSATRPSLADVSDQILVWIPDPQHSPEGLRLREAGYLRRFEEHMQAQSQRFLLVPSTEGLSADFRRRAKAEFRVSVTTPVQFFDAPFRWEANPTAATAASALRNRDEVRNRIAQPYESSGEPQQGDDLLPTLLTALRARGPQVPPVQLVAAPAGFGKSHLFKALFTRLYEDFVEAKRTQTQSLRPLPLLPEYLAAATAPTLKALVTSFLATDVARPLSLDSFEWMLTHGYACFLIDGLDEVIARDPQFFEYLYELLTRPDVPFQPRILICVRDSLLASNRGLRHFLDDAGESIQTHRLTAWRESSVGRFVQLKLGQQEAAPVLAQLTANPNLMRMAGTPFYCQLLTEDLARQGRVDADSETRLLGDAVANMIGREFDKSLLARHWASRSEVEILIQDIAEENLEGGSKGVTVNELAELAQYSLPADLDEADQEVAVEQLKQLPFFSSTGDLGRLSFSQEVIYDYLLGVRAATYLSSNRKRFVYLMGVRELSPDSATLRVLRETVTANRAQDDLYSSAVDALGDATAFRNILRLVLASPDTGWILRRVALERQDLSALVIRDADLSNLSLRGANLEATEFHNCNLTNAVFAEAVLKGTVLRDCRGVESVEFGDLSTFFSAVLNVVHVEDSAEWVRVTGAGESQPHGRYVRPCAAASQVRFVFSKFIRADGVARRDWLDEKAVLSGRRFVDPAPVVEGARRHGYLDWDGARGRYQRSRGVEYSEMVNLVAKLQLTPKLRLLLSEVCKAPGCRHLLEVEAAAS